MENRFITDDALQAFAASLIACDRALVTVHNYLRAVNALARWLGAQPVSVEALRAYRAALQAQGRAAMTINTQFAAINSFCRFMEWDDCRLPLLRVQRRLFRAPERELSLDEYERLVLCARKRGQTWLALVMETLCATGIRVSELSFVTVAAAEVGRADITLKGKTRTILLPRALCRKLRAYAREKNIADGEIFLTAGGRSLSRQQIWAAMKKLAVYAGVAASKIFPHNLRHLFATTYYAKIKDVVRLADILGHTSVNTTRLYLCTSGAEHVRQLEGLHLVL